MIAPAQWTTGAAGGCDLTGAWDDGMGPYELHQTGATVVASPLGAPPGWTRAVGTFDEALDALNMTFFPAGAIITATATAACSQLAWSNGARWVRTQPRANITQVHVVFMTHL